jgi:adenosylcobinamide-phosphate synthase
LAFLALNKYEKKQCLSLLQTHKALIGDGQQTRKSPTVIDINEFSSIRSKVVSCNWCLMVINIVSTLIAVSIIVLAIIIDLLLGDPSPWSSHRLRHTLHPTVWMGKLTKALEPHLKNSNPKIEKLNGVFLALVIVAAFAIPAYLGLSFIYIWLGVFVYVIIAAIILKFTICIKLETDGAMAVARAIESGDLTEAKRYAHFSRRESKDLTGPQIASAVIESMVENLTDFKLSPFIYYAFLGVPGAVAFRAINTLDGMVGFKDPEHINIGWFSATLDTVINYIPARLTTVLMIVAAAMLGEDYKNAWKIASRDHAKVPSRNHGWQMAAIAGALNIQLEKPSHYVVGDQTELLTPDKIARALRVRNVAIVLCLLLILPVFLLVSPFLFPY